MIYKYNGTSTIGSWRDFRTNSSSLGPVALSFSNEVSPALTRVVLSVSPILSSCLEMCFECSHNLGESDCMHVIQYSRMRFTLLVCTCEE